MSEAKVGASTSEARPESPAALSDRLADLVLARRASAGFRVASAVGVLLLLVFVVAVSTLFVAGIGIWGVNQPVAWGFAIVNFVWWIGIGHAGTFISAILLLLRQTWRNPINRLAEAMTLFAVACAGLMPILHLGRPELFYWLLPYPSASELWPQFRSPLVWDVFAIGTYATVSLLFFYLGLLPDLATLRERARSRGARLAYGLAAMGWRGDARHWRLHERTMLLLAGLATPLVVSVHSVVSFDFAVAQLPGWHSLLFPPYFVAGAVYSGFALVFLVMLPLRSSFGLQDVITARHLDVLARVTLASGWIVTFGYAMEYFTIWYGGNEYELAVLEHRTTGAYAPVWYGQMLLNVVVPQLLWWRRVRRSPVALFLVSLAVAVGMWLERYDIVIVSLYRDFMPSAWGEYHGTLWDWGVLLGSFGLFLVLFLLFVRFLPQISIFEMRKQRREGLAGTEEGS